MTVSISGPSRPRQGPLAALVAAPALALCACMSAPDLPPTASAGDCVDVRLWSNGFHTSIAFQAGMLDEAHTIRARFPRARYFLVGWGERDYFVAPAPDALDAARAAFWPTPSAVQIIAHDTPVEETIWRGSDLATFGLSREGAARLSAALEESLARDARGRPVVLGEGRVEGASVFIAAERDFHLFHMCNHWMAARLREAGVPVRAALSFTAGGLMAAVRDKAAAPCPSTAPRPADGASSAL